MAIVRLAMTRSRTRLLLTIILGLVVLTAGCSGAGGGDAGGPTVADSGEYEAADGDGGDGGSGGGDAAVPAATGTPMATPQPREAESASTGGQAGNQRQIRFSDRMLIRTGQVHLEVDDFEAARRNLSRAVNQHGGYVSDSSVERHRIDNKSYKTGMVVLRIPAENFTAMMGETEAVGTVLESRTNVEDVTEQLVDIEARLENLRAQRDQLRKLYRNATDTEDVLAVQRRLSDVQGEIERLEARQQNLRRQVALSTIRVRMEEPRPEPDPVEIDRWYEVGVLSAFLESVDGVIVTLRALVVSVAYILPYLLVFGVPVVAGVVAIWARRRGRLP